jgi:hypothetical protein
MTTEPVPGGEAGVPPDGVCEGGVLVRVMGKIGEMENAIIEKGVDWTFPLTPPEELGLDSWIDGGSISFYVECPTGETQYADPIITTFDPKIYTFARFTGIGYGREAGIFGGSGKVSITSSWTNISDGRALSWRGPIIGFGTWQASGSATVGGLRGLGFPVNANWFFNQVLTDGSILPGGVARLDAQWSTITKDGQMALWLSGGWEFSTDTAAEKNVEATWIGNDGGFADPDFDPDNPSAFPPS